VYENSYKESIEEAILNKNKKSIKASKMFGSENDEVKNNEKALEKTKQDNIQSLQRHVQSIQAIKGETVIPKSTRNSIQKSLATLIKDCLAAPLEKQDEFHNKVNAFEQNYNKLQNNIQSLNRQIESLQAIKDDRVIPKSVRDPIQKFLEKLKEDCLAATLEKQYDFNNEIIAFEKNYNKLQDNVQSLNRQIQSVKDNKATPLETRNLIIQPLEKLKNDCLFAPLEKQEGLSQEIIAFENSNTIMLNKKMYKLSDGTTSAVAPKTEPKSTAFFKKFGTLPRHASTIFSSNPETKPEPPNPTKGDRPKT
jgi:uncharacterized protein (UPF0147 family)